jgi:hypothetical protein
MSRASAPHRHAIGLSFALVALFGACAMDPAAETAAAPPTGAVRGQLITYIFDFPGHSEQHHSLRLPSGEERELRLASKPELPSGTVIDVWGSDDGRAIQVSRLAAVAGMEDGIAKKQSALKAGTKRPTKRWAFVLVDTGGANNLTKESGQLKLFSDQAESIRSYYREVSYGLQDLDGDVIGPLSIDPATVPGGLCQGFLSVGKALKPMIGDGYDQYLFYFETKTLGCGWAGVAILGTADKPKADSYYNASSDCVVLVQEPGHNFGMVHSSALRCTRGGLPVSMINPTDTQSSCTHDEYGNPFDPMGGGAAGMQPLTTCYHMNGVQKAYQDWLEGCNIVKATTSGTFTIYPLETACNGTQLLEVPLPEAGTRNVTLPPAPGSTISRAYLAGYYLELRAPVGLDAQLMKPRVFVTAAGNLKEARLRGNNNWLIDTTPETRTMLDADLAVGKTYSDPVPFGPKFTLLSIDETKAVVRVQLHGEAAVETPGDGVCSDDTPFAGPGPASCDAPAPPPRGGSGGGAGTGGRGGDLADAGEADADPNQKEDAPPLNRHVTVKGCAYGPAGHGESGRGLLPLALALFLAAGRRRQRPR